MADHGMNRRCAIVAIAVVASALHAGSCTKKAHQGEGRLLGSVGASSDAATDAAPEASSAQSATAPAATWVEAVRVGNWRVASRQLEALDDKQREEPEIKYVRARALLVLGDHAAALRLLERLEKPLPILAHDIAFYRAEAQIQTGPVEEAARYFASQTRTKSLVKAAIAWEKAGRLKEARETIERAVRASGRRTDEAAIDARVVRARLAEAQGDRATAAADLRWVARQDPSRAEADDIGEAIARLDPKSALTASERIDRAHRLARDGNSGAALEEIERAANAPGKRPTAAEITYAKAMSLYLDREHYVEAAQSFEQAARQDRALTPQATWYAAKAWARADQNDRATARYRELAQAYPKLRWGERASYQLARLAMLEARWSDAAQSYATYMVKHPRGENVDSARYEQAVCLLLAGRADKARPLLAQLASRSSDALTAAQLRELEGLAAFQSGDPKSASELWNAVVRDLPLSWPALLSAARLVAAGQPSPLPIQPPPSIAKQPLQPSLPQLPALLRRLGLDRDAADWLREHEQESTAAFAERSGEGLCLLYGQLAEARRRYSLATQVAPGSWLSQAPSSATRWSWECLFPKPYPQLVEELEQRDSLLKGLLHSIMRQESGFNPEARSPAGALGLMQLMPTTAKKIAEETSTAYDPEQLYSPAQNLDLASRYLAKLTRAYRGYVPLIAAAYNAGPKAVNRWLQRAGTLPLDLWVARIPYVETRKYVWRVLGNLARYGYLERANDGLPAIDLKLPEGLEPDPNAY